MRHSKLYFLFLQVDKGVVPLAGTNGETTTQGERFSPSVGLHCYVFTSHSHNPLWLLTALIGPAFRVR